MRSKKIREKKARVTGKTERRGGYRGFRDDSGLTPMQRLSARKADLAEIEIAERKGALVLREDVEAGLREGGEVIGSDLRGTMVSRATTELSGRGNLEPEQVRAVMSAIVEEIIGGWAKAGVARE